MKAYKGTYNRKCRNVLFEDGYVYEYCGESEICKTGYHACEKADDVFLYYDRKEDFVLLEVEILGDTDNYKDKICTNKLKIIREIPKNQYNDVFNNHKFDENNNKI